MARIRDRCGTQPKPIMVMPIRAMMIEEMIKASFGEKRVSSCWFSEEDDMSQPYVALGTKNGTILLVGVAVRKLCIFISGKPSYKTSLVIKNGDGANERYILH